MPGCKRPVPLVAAGGLQCVGIVGRIVHIGCIGRRVFAASQNAGVMGGSLGEMHANKIVKAMQMAINILVVCSPSSAMM